MIKKENPRCQLYDAIGKLFYAIAMVDKNVTIYEVEQLKKNVRRYWVSDNGIEEELEIDVANQINMFYACLHQEGKVAQIHFDEFLDYYRKHRKKFPPNIKQLILKTAGGITSSSTSRNKSEQLLLAKLWMLLN
ncbi:hypothetical protein [Arenibacter sp. S6351L]|jgi:hypothetical protein|uniref:hypothetical protein n=1 Tax=Arenibacter sp. S6351L TaxID=2926407 RepID=UPI001FF38C2A|nr:hypothetical protein [Arenibacter sp. S6351L]MCK0135520.1 hypothetical protein [Arenibacter sp. S6351L]